MGGAVVVQRKGIALSAGMCRCGRVGSMGVMLKLWKKRGKKRGCVLGESWRGRGCVWDVKGGLM
jgi:hypothetical protein